MEGDQPKLKIWAPADIRQCKLLPNPGETPEELELTQRALDEILKKAGY